MAQTAARLSEAKRKLLDKLVGESPAKPAEIAPIARRCPVRAGSGMAPLALSQEQLLIREQMARPMARPMPLLYNESVTLRLKFAVDGAALERSIAEVIRRHEIWRTSYPIVDGQRIQLVHPAEERFPLSPADLRTLSERERESQVLALSVSQTARPFDLLNGPLLRGTLVAMSDSEYWLAMTIHQSIIDGVSVYQIFPEELFAIYRAFSAGRLSPLGDLPLQFSDFAWWQRDWLSGAERERQIAYWRTKLSGAVSVPRWPGTKERPAERTFRGNIRSFTLRRTAAEAARALSRRQSTTTFVVLLAAFYSLLHGYTGQSDLIVGTFSPSGRKRSEVQGLLGYFLNPVALRIDVGDDPTFAELTRRVQTTVSEAISNDDVPFEQIVEALQPSGDESRNPYFDAAISLQPPMRDCEGAYEVTSMDAESGGALLDLYIAFIDQSEELHARVQFNPDIFEADQAGRIVEEFQRLLEAAASKPEERVSKLYDHD